MDKPAKTTRQPQKQNHCKSRLIPVIAIWGIVSEYTDRESDWFLARALGPPFECKVKPNFKSDADFLNSHCELGHLPIVQWLRANGAPLDEWAITYAAKGGQLEVVQWLHANGAPWDASAIAWAAREGHLEVVQWLRANGAPWDIRAITWAAEGGHLEMVQWLRANGAPEINTN